MYGSRYLKSYADQDLICANFICNVQITGSYHLEDDITRIACSLLFLYHLYLYWCVA